MWFFGHNFMSFSPTRNLTTYICSCQSGLYGNLWIYYGIWEMNILCTSVCILRYEAAQNEDTETSSTSEIIFFRSPDLHFSKIYVYQLHILSDSFHSKSIYPVVWCYLYQKWIEIFVMFRNLRADKQCSWLNSFRLDHAFEIPPNLWGAHELISKLVRIA